VKKVRENFGRIEATGSDVADLWSKRLIVVAASRTSFDW